MKINFVYNSLINDICIDELFDGIEEEIHIFDMSYPKEAKKGRVVLNRYAAKELPFMEIMDEKIIDNDSVLEKTEDLVYVSYGEVNKEVTNKDVKEILKIYKK